MFDEYCLKQILHLLPQMKNKIVRCLWSDDQEIYGILKITELIVMER